MKRIKEVPPDLLAYMDNRKKAVESAFKQLNILCTFPVRAVRMKILRDMDEEEIFHTVIIPAVDVYATERAILKKGFLKRDALSYFVSGTHKAFPYGHVYTDSGYVCLGSIFVPSAVPEYSAAMPIETLFLHNDRNLSHGNSHLFIDREMAKDIESVMRLHHINPSFFARKVRDGVDIIRNDEIWNLSADVVEQKTLPEALSIMESIYSIIFREERKKEEEKRKQEEEKQRQAAEEQEDKEAEE